MMRISAVLEGCVVGVLSGPTASDVWRLAVVERLTNVACVSAAQAARILACFAHESAQVVSGVRAYVAWRGVACGAA